MIAHLQGMADYPGVTCEGCRDMLGVDGVQPRCQTDAGCWIPEVGPVGLAVIKARKQLHVLGDVIGRDVLMKSLKLSPGEIELLTVIEDFFSEAKNGRAKT